MKSISNTYMNLETTAYHIQKIKNFEKDDFDYINKFLNEIPHTVLNQIKEKNFKSEKDVIRYIKRNKSKNYPEVSIKPVNLLRYRIYQYLSNGNKIEIKRFFEDFDTLLKTKQVNLLDISPTLQDIFIKSGWGESEDPFHSWSDLRKLIYDYIIPPLSMEKMKKELQAIYSILENQLNFNDYQENIKLPWGSQNNSFHDHCWIAWCPGNTMKKTVHLGLRIYEDSYHTLLYVGDEVYSEAGLENQTLDEAEFNNLTDAFRWIKENEQLCLNLNQLENLHIIKDELKNIKKEDIEEEGDLFYPSRVGYKDSLGLQNGSRRISYQDSRDIENSFLYLYKIEGIEFKSDLFVGNAVYKIGISKKPKYRKKGIIKGFGLSSLLSIKTLLIKENFAKYESAIKEMLDKDESIYYDGEYFCSDLEESKLLSLITRKLNSLTRE